MNEIYSIDGSVKSEGVLTCGLAEWLGRDLDRYPTGLTSSGAAYSLALLSGLKLDMMPSAEPPDKITQSLNNTSEQFPLYRYFINGTFLMTTFEKYDIL